MRIVMAITRAVLGPDVGTQSAHLDRIFPIDCDGGHANTFALVVCKALRFAVIGADEGRVFTDASRTVPRAVAILAF